MTTPLPPRERRLNLARLLWSLRINCNNSNTIPPTAVGGIRHDLLLYLFLKDHQSLGSSHIVVSVAAGTVEADQEVQPSLPRLSADTLMIPTLKSRARFTWSLPRPRRRLSARAPHWQSM